MALAEGVGPRMPLLRFTAADVAAGGTESEIEPAAAFLATIGLRLRERLGHVIT